MASDHLINDQDRIRLRLAAACQRLNRMAAHSGPIPEPELPGVGTANRGRRENGFHPRPAVRSFEVKNHHDPFIL